MDTLIILLLTFLSAQVRKSRVDLNVRPVILSFSWKFSIIKTIWWVGLSRFLVKISLCDYLYACNKRTRPLSLVAEIYLQLFGLSLGSGRGVEGERRRLERMFLLFWQAWKWIHGKSLSYSAGAIVKRETPSSSRVSRFQRSEMEESLTEGLHDKRDGEILENSFSLGSGAFFHDRALKNLS